MVLHPLQRPEQLQERRHLLRAWYPQVQHHDRSYADLLRQSLRFDAHRLIDPSADSVLNFPKPTARYRANRWQRAGKGQPEWSWPRGQPAWGTLDHCRAAGSRKRNRGSGGGCPSGKEETEDRAKTCQQRSARGQVPTSLETAEYTFSGHTGEGDSIPESACAKRTSR